MIKYLKYMFMAAIIMIAATGCQEDIEDTFSKEPAAPELVNNGTILMTKNTMSESITWAWSAARFMKGETSYTLYAQYGDAIPVQVGSSTKGLSLTLTKNEFQTLLGGVQGIPENASFDLSFYVEATDENGGYKSAAQLMTVYSYGDAVSAVLTANAADVILDITAPAEELQLLTWEAARLEYGEAITYNVYITYNGGELTEVATGLTETACSKTVDEWNELVVASGAPEAQAADVEFIVKAYSETYPEGIPSAPLSISITTYKATYPAYLLISGTDKKFPHSTVTKGLFDCFVNLESGVSFKFIDQDTQTEYGSDDVETTTDDKGNVVTSGTIGSGVITIPAGLYRISADIKFGTLQIVKINSMGMIGAATPNGWNAELPMEYDATANTYSVVTTLTQDGEYKFRANDNWGFAIDKNGDFRDGGDNMVFEKETGEYKVVLDVNSHPYTAKILSTSFPEKLYLPGAQNWNVPFTLYLGGNGEGKFEGGVNMTSNEWKFSPVTDWGQDFAGTIELNEAGYGKGVYGGSGNINTPAGYYYIQVDMTTGTFEMQRIDKVGLIGSFNDWKDDAVFVYDAEKNVWTLSDVTLTTTDEFKIRFNAAWDMNRGCEVALTPGTKIPVNQDGNNMKVAEDGNYTITVDMSTNPNTITVVK